MNCIDFRDAGANERRLAATLIDDELIANISHALVVAGVPDPVVVATVRDESTQLEILDRVYLATDPKLPSAMHCIRNSTSARGLWVFVFHGRETLRFRMRTYALMSGGAA